jgi:hypothetical protein
VASYTTSIATINPNYKCVYMVEIKVQNIVLEHGCKYHVHTLVVSFNFFHKNF